MRKRTDPIEQQQELEGHLIVHREAYPVVPPKAEHSLTKQGHTLIPLLDSMHQWGKDYMEHNWDTETDSPKDA